MDNNRTKNTTFTQHSGYTQTANNLNIPVRFHTHKQNELQKMKALEIIALIHQPTHTHVGNFSYAFFRNDTKTIKSVLDIRNHTSK